MAAGANWQMAIWMVLTTSSAQQTMKQTTAAPIMPMMMERGVAVKRSIIAIPVSRGRHAQGAASPRSGVYSARGKGRGKAGSPVRSTP